MRLVSVPLVLLALLVTGCESPGEKDSINLTEGWTYRWGDSPVRPDGSYEWVHDETPAAWLPAGDLYVTPEGREGREYIWYRVALPETQWATPTIYLPNVHLAFQIYLGTKLVYEAGTFAPHSNIYSHATIHLVSSRVEHAVRYLTIRLYSDERDIGFQTQGDPIAVGSANGITRMIVRRSVENLLLGLAAMFIGLICLFVYVRRAHARGIYVFSLGMFSLFIGFFYSTFPPVYDLLLPNPLRLYAQFCSYLIFPVWMYLFVSQMLRSRIITMLWVAHAVWAAVVIPLMMLGHRSLPGPVPIDALFAITIPTMTVVAFRAARSGHREARVFMIGLIVMGLTGLNDVLAGMRVIPYTHWLSPWGTLFFILTLVYLVDRRFVERTELLKVYSSELEQKSEQLEEYTHTLEERVHERTRDVEEKNRELAGTLDELRNTQQQLVMREKMASLGNLVAGVAHEVNNPIGAINSAADACKRCVTILSDFVERGDSSETEPRVEKALGILDENTKLIGTAGHRVAEIVRSLRNFSRLDEAEFQEADIHEGLDSTLTLVNHKLKRRVEVVRHYGDIPRINCYPNQLNQVFMNVLVNAAQAIEGKGTITITTRAEGNEVVVSVADDGKGIAPDHVVHLFDPGFTTKGAGVGTGLGLSISYNIVEKHGGSIGVESEVGKGSTFTVRLPIRAGGAS